MNLMQAEISRFFSRRFIQLMLVLLVVVLGIMVYTVTSESHAPTAEMWARAEGIAERQRDSLQWQFEACVRSNAGVDGACAGYHPDRVRPEHYLSGVFTFSTRIGGLLMLLAVVLGFFGFLVMSSFVGAEMRSGGMTNLLLWRPNRMAVLGAKFGVGLGLITTISAVFAAVYVGVFYVVADATGWVGTADGAFWERIFWLCVRANAFALLMAVLAFAIATLGRHTAAALGALIGYVVVWEAGGRVVADSLNVYDRDNEWLFLSSHVYNWLNQPYDGGEIGGMTWTDSGTIFLVLAAAATAIAFTTFRRRDVA